MKKIIKTKPLKRFQPGFRKKSKVYFQLLEVLIGLFLIVTIALPITQSFVSSYTEQRKMLKVIELDHLAHLAHAKVTEELYRDAGKSKRSIQEYTEQHGTIHMESSWFPESSPIRPGQYDFTYEMKLLEQKKKKSEPEPEKLLLALTIKITERGAGKVSREYPYLLYVHRKPLS